MSYIRYLTILILFCSTPSYLFAAEKDGELEAAAIWEVQSSSNKIYLLGELHVLDLPSEKTISFVGVKKVFDSVDIFWTEALLAPTAPMAVTRNSLVVSTDTWHKLSKVVEKTIKDITSKRTTDLQETISRNFLKEIDELSPVEGFKNLGAIGTMAALLKNRSQRNPVAGFMGEMAVAFEEKRGVKKLRFLEDENTNVTAWNRSCNTIKDTEQLFLESLHLFETDSENNPTQRDLTLWFDDFLKNPARSIQLPNSVATSILIKCNVIPRNHAWYPTIKTALSDTNKPQAFLVGIAHILGNEGLLEMLKAEGKFRISRLQ